MTNSNIRTRLLKLHIQCVPSQLFGNSPWQKKKTLKRAAESVIIGSGKYKFIQEIFKIRLFIL